ncbi:MAG: sulfurtransferase [Silanimonas sp.]|nr:MAG: sulfurtransferase [Silanimonas sp.]
MLGLIKALFGAGSASVSAATAHELQRGGVPLVDVRENGEWAAGHAPGAFHVPLGEVQAEGLAALEARGVPLAGEGPVLFICRSGMRSGAACGALRSALGERAVNVEGGMMAWTAAGLPVETGR